MIVATNNRALKTGLGVEFFCTLTQWSFVGEKQPKRLRAAPRQERSRVRSLKLLDVLKVDTVTC